MGTNNRMEQEEPRENYYEENLICWPEHKRRILIEEDSKETIIYFFPDDYSITKEEMDKKIHSLFWSGCCTGRDLARFNYGEIRLFFNPLDFETRTQAVSRVVERLRETVK